MKGKIVITWKWNEGVDDAAKSALQPTLDRLSKRIAEQEYADAVERHVADLIGMPIEDIQDAELMEIERGFKL